MTRTLILPIAIVCGLLFGGQALAQGGNIPGWYPLPDSLFLIWDLEQDQVRRIRVIEEDHTVERAEVLANAAMSAQAKDQRLEQLATERRREIKAVLQIKQFEDWERRSKMAGAR